MDNETIQKITQKITSLGLATPHQIKFHRIKPSGANCTARVTTDSHELFVKWSSSNSDAFSGEATSLLEIDNAIPSLVPKVFGWGTLLQGGFLITQHLNLSSSILPAEFGLKLGKLHQTATSQSFGFQCPTYCGSTRLDNTWNNNWIEFFKNQRLEAIVAQIPSRELSILHKQLQDKLPFFFTDGDLTPRLVHGDLWSGNYATHESKCVILDPAAFYAHHEFDLGMLALFGHPGHGFYSAYHSIMPKFEKTELRVELYKIWHLLNHWAIFGESYASASLSCIQSLLAQVYSHHACQ
jgi:protein-ribulosamine 3-kinase